MGSETGSATSLLAGYDLPLAMEVNFDPHLDTWLGDLALAAQTGDRAARDLIYHALSVKLHRLTISTAAPLLPMATCWNLDDAWQEAYLVLTDLIEHWPGQASFSGYVLSRFHLRLRDRLRRLSGGRMAIRRRAHLSQVGGHPDVDGDGDLDGHRQGGDGTPRGLANQSAYQSAAGEALLLLERIAVDLPEPGATILLLRVRDGQPFGAIADCLGLNRRTVNRHWRIIRRNVRSVLGHEDTVGHADARGS